jgi:hypothetical protein
LLGAVTAYEGRGVQFIISSFKKARLNASFPISREGGEKPIGSSPCATESPSQQRRTRAVPIVRHARVQLPGLRHQHETRFDLLVWLYDQRAGAENLIKEGNNDAGLAAYPSGRGLMNCNHVPV